MRLELVCVVALGVGLLLMLGPGGCTPTGVSGGMSLDARLIRVRIVQSADQVTLAATQPPTYHSASDTTDRVLELPRNTAMALSLSGGRWRVGGADLGSGTLTLVPSAVGSVAVNNIAYRGQYRAVPLASGKFDLVNDVDVDEYLMGVVSRELFPTFHESAYQAQAIAARTYALYEKIVPREARHWDVHPDERSQVYGGIPGESAKSRDAVEATRGLVLGHGNPGEERIFKTYFSSCCGGITQAVSDAFPGSPYIEPLRAQNVGPVCSIAPKFNWGPIVITKEELSRRFRLFGVNRNRAEKDMGLVQSVQIEARNAYGRPVRFAIIDSRGLRYSLPCEEFRWAVNTGASDGTKFYSSYIENIINESDRVRFVGGHGYGHGVGMCQWCAEARAAAGVSAEDILMYAYPGAKIIRAY